MLLKCALCNAMKSRLLKEQEANGLLSSLGIQTNLSKITLVGLLLFWRHKMNEIVSKVLLAWDKFMPEMHLRQPRFSYNAVNHKLNTKSKYKSLKQQEIQDIFIKMNYVKLAFNMVWLIEIVKIFPKK